MREPLQKELLTCFEREFQVRFPLFTRELAEQGFWVWQRNVSSKTVVFVALQAFDRQDQFVLEIGWHEIGKFPWSAGADRDPECAEARIRLSDLWVGEASEEIWDLTPESSEAMQKRYDARIHGGDFVPYPEIPLEVALSRIEPLVHDSLEKLEQYAIPLFNSVASARGTSWPIGV